MQQDFFLYFSLKALNGAHALTLAAKHHSVPVREGGREEKERGRGGRRKGREGGREKERAREEGSRRMSQFIFQVIVCAAMFKLSPKFLCSYDQVNRVLSLSNITRPLALS